MRLSLPILLICLTCAPALAGSDAKSAVKYASYSISSKREKVKGRYLLNGFTPAQIKGFIEQDCRGKVGPLVPVGKPRKKRGEFYQKYETTCQDGLAAHYKGKNAGFEVELLGSGKVLTEITTSDGHGNIIFIKEYR
jgi:hypothetical protein